MLARRADYAVVTSDNPRTESPQAILDGIVAGMDDVPYEVLENRREAITRALSLAEESDLVLLAGKGHETTQEIHGVRHAFDDRVEAARALSALAAGGDL